MGLVANVGQSVIPWFTPSLSLINGFNLVKFDWTFMNRIIHNPLVPTCQIRPSKTLCRCSRKTFIDLPSFMKVASPSTTISIRFPAYHHLFPHHPSISGVALWGSAHLITHPYRLEGWSSLPSTPQIGKVPFLARPRRKIWRSLLQREHLIYNNPTTRHENLKMLWYYIVWN